jgi:hypothetical protein
MKKIILIIFIISFYAFAECSVYLRNVTYLSEFGYKKMDVNFADSIRNNKSEWNKYDIKGTVCLEIQTQIEKNRNDTLFRPFLYGFIYDGMNFFFLHDFSSLTDSKKNILVSLDSLKETKKELISIEAFYRNYKLKKN